MANTTIANTKMRSFMADVTSGECSRFPPLRIARQSSFPFGLLAQNLVGKRPKREILYAFLDADTRIVAHTVYNRDGFWRSLAFPQARHETLRRDAGL